MSSKLDVLAIGAHPDDVELGCGGTLATLIARGYRAGIVHLTRGEASTRGTPAERRLEAEAAAETLGVHELRILDCHDGGLHTTAAQEDAVIEVLRDHRPELVLGPTPTDRHPDHGRAHRLVGDAAFYAGLAKRATGDPHRPAAVFSYMQHDPFSPAFLVDVTEAWPKKLAALACYGSQLHQSTEPDRQEPMTKVASASFAASVIGRAQHFGQMIGVDYAEPFWSRMPLSVDDPMMLVPKGLR